MQRSQVKRFFKCIIYYSAKSLGLFKLALKLTENKSRILCYHGGSIEDEHLFEPTVFISTEVFKKHLQLIKKYQFKVLPLDTLVDDMANRRLQKRSLVLTFDDGLYNTTLLEPLLKEAQYPATLYVSSYYISHQSPIFNLTFAYLFFKTKHKSFSIALHEGKEQVFETKGKAGFHAKLTFIAFAPTVSEEKQNQLLQQLSVLLDVDLEPIISKRLFHNVTRDELNALHEEGVFDVQLHTHRHNLPLDEKEFIYEIVKNRQVLSEMTGKNGESIRHFCYPCGVWNTNQFEPLKKLGVISATTLEPGLNEIDENVMSLKRILCDDDKSLIFFEAHLTGFHALLKENVNRIKQLFTN